MAQPEVFASHDRAVVQQVIGALGLHDFLAQRLNENQPPLQLILPTCRIDVDADDEFLADQLTRELGLPRAQLERALVKAARASRTMATLIEQRDQWLAAGVGPEWEAERLDTEPGSCLHAILRGPTAAVSSVLEDQVGDLIAARTWSSWRRGTHSLTGGLLSLRLELHNIVVEAGGEILMDADPLGLLQRQDGSVAGVMLEGRPGTIRAERFVLGFDLERLASLLQDGSPLKLQLPTPRVAARRYVVHLFFRRGWIPPSMGDNLLVLGQQGAQPPGGLMHVVRDDLLTGEEQVLAAQVLVSPRRCTRFDLSRVKREVIQTIEQLVPFFEEGFLQAVSPNDGQEPWSGGQPQGRGAARTGSRVLPMAPVFSLDHELMTLEGDSLAGAPAAPLCPGDTGVALTHPLVLGALGTEGAFTTALAAADLLASKAGG
jgi:hypothetical protein